jgi:hypothetical protein
MSTTLSEPGPAVRFTFGRDLDTAMRSAPSQSDARRTVENTFLWKCKRCHCRPPSLTNAFRIAVAPLNHTRSALRVV